MNGNTNATTRLMEKCNPNSKILRSIPKLLKSQQIHLVNHSLDSSTSSVNENCEKSINDDDDHNNSNNNATSNNFYDNNSSSLNFNYFNQLKKSMPKLNTPSPTTGIKNKDIHLSNGSATIKHKNNLNVLRSSNFAIPVNSEDDF